MKFDTVHVGIGDYSSRKIPLYSADQNKNLLKFQIPRMYIPFGLNTFNPEVGDPKWNIDFNLNDSPEVQKFVEFVQGVEKDVIDKVYEDRVQIFGNANLSYETVQAMFNSNIKRDKFRVKFEPDKSMVYDSKGQPIIYNEEPGLFSKNSGIAMVELGSVYFLNKMFGLVWKIKQLKLYETSPRLSESPPQQSLTGFQFVGI